MSLRLFFHVVGIEARRRMSYRLDFWISASALFVTSFGLAWLLWRAIFDSSGATTLGGYTFHAMLLYMVVVVLFERIVRGNDLESTVSSDIYQGGLVRYLVFPVPYFGFKYAQAVGSLLPGLVQLCVFGCAFALILGMPDDVHITPWTILGCLVTVGLAHYLYFVMNFPLESVAFWAENVWSLTVALRMATGLLGGALVPLALFPDWARSALEWTPFPLLFFVPAQTLMGRVSPGEWIQGVLVAAAWVVAIRFVAALTWKRGCLQWSGVGQ